MTMPNDTPRGTAAAGRLRYRERQPVRRDDLTAEQAYLLARRHRHDRGQHGWGIVAGLALAPGTGAVLVQPGVAVDGYGRSLVASGPIRIPHDLLSGISDGTGAEAIDVWLLYGRGPCHDARSPETPDVRLLAVEHADADPGARKPGEVSAQELDGGPEGFSPDDPGREWPVYLGRLTPGSGGTWDVHLDDRPYASLVGEAIVSPGRDARLQVGGERSGDPLRFGVQLGVAGGPLTDRLTIDRTGAVAVQGDLRLDGTLTLSPSGKAASGAGLGRLPAVPPAAMPWRVYRTLIGQGPVKTDELRLEIGHPGDKGDPTRYRLAVGYVDDLGKFQRCLSVRADCTVAVGAGKLAVDPGKLLVNAPAKADPADPRFAAEIIAQWLDSIARAGVKLDALYAGALIVTIGGTGPVGQGKSLSYTVTVRNAGPAQVRQVVVADTVTVEGTTVGGGQLPMLATLDPGEDRTRHRQVQAPAGSSGKKLRITATAVGTGPPGYPVQATPVSIEVDITT